MDQGQGLGEALQTKAISEHESSARKVVPFLKWAGGKRWFVEARPRLIPTTYNTYIEPFLGSGAVYFHVAPTKGILADNNEALIETYAAIREDWEAVVDELRIHHEQHSKQYYYKVRDQRPRIPARRAARFIYLNRTCWNGLYRVNLDGKFNVPIGTKTNVLLPTDNFEGVARMLDTVVLLTGDFQKTIELAGKGDFVFVDPPYVTKRHNGAFIKYNEKLFAWDDQIALRDALVQAKKRDVKILATNSNNKVVRRLYENDFNVSTTSRSSVISGTAASRGRSSELIIWWN